MLIRCALYIVCIVYYPDVIIFIRVWKQITLLHQPNSLLNDGIESQAVREHCYKGLPQGYNFFLGHEEVAEAAEKETDVYKFECTRNSILEIQIHLYCVSYFRIL